MQALYVIAIYIRYWSKTNYGLAVSPRTFLSYSEDREALWSRLYGDCYSSEWIRFAFYESVKNNLINSKGKILKTGLEFKLTILVLYWKELSF